MPIDNRLSDLLLEWEQGRRDGREPAVEELCRDTPELLPMVRESIDSLRATDWMFAPEPSGASSAVLDPAALHDTELPKSHLTVEEFTASIFQSGLLSAAEIEELKGRLAASDLTGEAREVALKLVTEGKLTQYQASVLLKASHDPLLVDNYVILETLDTGGMGLVFKALHRSMNRVVALKLLPASMMSAHDTVKRFQREVKAAAALKHPNVVAAYDADESSEIAYLVLEYVEGTNLFRLVKDHGMLPVARAVDYVRQAASGLAYLHSRGIIHRDVKPANLILSTDGTVKLLDMGLVRFASSEDLSCAEMDQELTQAGIVIGTVAYMSPEQALDTRSADERSDIYSLGCTLFFLLTGRSLYYEETGMKTLLAHREQAVPSLRQFCEDVPPSLDAVFRTMVAKRPSDRLQTMEEVIAAMDACIPGLPSAQGQRSLPASRPFSLLPPRPLGRGRGWGSVALALGTVAVLGGAIYLAGILIRIKSDKGTTDIYVDDPNAEIQVIPNSTPPGRTEVGSATGRLAPRRVRDKSDPSRRTAAPPAPGSSPFAATENTNRLSFQVPPEPTVENDICEAEFQGNSFSVTGIVRAADNKALNDLTTTHGQRLRQAVAGVLYRTKSQSLTESEFDRLKADLKEAINKVLPSPMVQEVLVPVDLFREPASRATGSSKRNEARDPQQAQSQKNNEQSIRDQIVNDLQRPGASGRFRGRDRRMPRASVPAAGMAKATAAQQQPSQQQPPAYTDAELDRDPSPDHAVAQWLFFHGGQFGIAGQVGNPREVPHGDFKVIFMSFSVVPAEPKPFHFPPGFRRRLHQLTELKSVWLSGRKITDDTLDDLEALPELESLNLRGSGITDDGLRRLVNKKMKRLQRLDVSDTYVDDKGLQILAEIAFFQKPAANGPRPVLLINGTRTSAEAITAFQRAVPYCDVYASHIFSSPLVQQDPRVPMPPAPGSGDRAWSEWILRNLVGARIVTDVDPDTPVGTIAQLPPIDFHIRALEFVEDVGQRRLGLNGTIVSRFVDLKHLESLYIDRLAGWSDVAEYRRDILSAIGRLSQLKSLQILLNVSDQGLASIGQLIHLESLKVNGFEITDEGLKNLAPLHELTRLALERPSPHVHGQGLKSLAGLKNLRELSFPGSGIEDNSLANFEPFSKLEMLDLSGTWITGTGLSQLAKLSHLKELKLTGCRRLTSQSLAALEKLPALERLNLELCRIDDVAVPLLPKLKALRTLHLNGTHLSEGGILQITAALPQCNVYAGVGRAAAPLR